MADNVAQQQRARRLALALRENLKRRKAQARGRVDETSETRPLTELADKATTPSPPHKD